MCCLAQWEGQSPYPLIDLIKPFALREGIKCDVELITVLLPTHDLIMETNRLNSSY